MAKELYVGVMSPIYEEQDKTIDITASNISEYFTVSNGSYYFKGSSSVFTTTNGGVNSSTATTTLTILSDASIEFDYSYSSEANYDKFTLTVAGTTVKNAVSGSTTTGHYSGVLTQGQTIVFKYAKDGSTHGYNDECTFSNMKLSGKVMQQVGEAPVAKRVIKSYIGIGNTAKRIKKAYIGIGGVARPFQKTGDLLYYGKLSNGTGYANQVGISTPKYAIFAGGYNFASDGGTNMYSTSGVKAYNTSLTTQTVQMDQDRCRFAGGMVGNYVVLGGGYWIDYYPSGSGSLQTVEAFDWNTLTHVSKSITSLNSQTYNGAATSLDDYILFAGGSGNSNQVEAYRKSLTKAQLTSPYIGSGWGLTSTTINNYAIFAGGYYNSASTSVYVIDNALTRISTSLALSQGRCFLAATITGNYALFAGGTTTGTYVNPESNNAWGASSRVDVISNSLTKMSNMTLSKARSYLAATNVDRYAIFAGGINSSGDPCSDTDVFNEDLTKTTITSLKNSKYVLSAATVNNNYAIFGSGRYSDDQKVTSSADVYTI